jgi:uncharacterized membrane protein YfcA
MNKLTKKLLALTPIAALLLIPSIASAQLGDIGNLVDETQSLVNNLIPLVAALALLAFFFGLAKYVFQADDDEAKDKGKQIMIAGIVSLFLIAAIGGIIEFIADAFGFGTNETIDPTRINTRPN